MSRERSVREEASAGSEQTVYIRDNGKMLFIYELNSDKLSEEEKIEAVFTLICKIEKPEKGHRYGRKIT